MSRSPLPPLIVHIIYRLGIGGLENGLVNIINNLPEDSYRHAIICLADSTEFSQRIKRQDVIVHQIHKRPGQDWASFYTVYRLLKQWQPSIVHTRNLAAIEYQVCALLAGVPYRVHGEHGWDVFDPDGSNVKYQWLRRILGSIIHRFIPLSQHLQDYLLNRVGIPASKITRICNGVDTKTFYPRSGNRQIPDDCSLNLDQKLVIGTVGRMHGVKDQLTLVRVFIDACENSPEFAQIARLFLIGDGPLRAEAIELLNAASLTDKVWLPGERDDIPEILRSLDIFVLPSKAEGISNTILEAMASGLPIIATRVGGNPELVLDGTTGRLVEKEDVTGMSAAMRELVMDNDKRRQLGKAALQRIQAEFSIDSMVNRYRQVYDKQ
ncbi:MULTISPECIES: TIGR03088 family PEP-CTERM/XrtA system glycosyltransferase [Methylomonas]|uniref:Sugar transferase n=2 Tax=Methylomonas TaxID=416 RepID=A0A126T1B7_9GAMM|nr:MULTISPECIES: TIGR03088 family PEP-CTERM/XrtA system glycosyltransferase [Methylomonas]AMK75880.1 sugar transferase [Methylomonas denitrificans]OAI01356.1 sugar transferase [Methylomonas methanica]TCV79244.1 sugar transferase (PEP-CTERM/EpsH1 system associated) [Methylomonas methanica]